MFPADVGEYTIAEGSMQAWYHSDVASPTTTTTTTTGATDEHSANSDSNNSNTNSDTKRSSFIFDHDKLRTIVKTVTRNLNKIIDINFYPIIQAYNSNMRHRPIGLGVQGLADAFQLMRLSFDCPEARRLNRDIFETIYYAALEASCELAEQLGPYESYQGSPASQGLLQFDLWEQKDFAEGGAGSVGVGAYEKRWDWAALKARIKQYGLRNSLLVAPMPTASTAQILGFNECIEPYTRYDSPSL